VEEPATTTKKHLSTIKLPLTSQESCPPSPTFSLNYQVFPRLKALIIGLKEGSLEGQKRGEQPSTPTMSYKAIKGSNHP
jgi:hypothetical protein